MKAGRQIDRSDEHPANIQPQRVQSLESASKIKLASFVQSRKQEWQSISIDEGMQIARSDEQLADAAAPSLESVEPRAKIKFESLPQPLRQ
jgi:hypothetical protein